MPERADGRAMYGTVHRDERARWAPVVARGQAWCAEVECVMPSRWIAPGSRWDLAHGDTPDTYRGPAHPRCNRREGAIRGNRARVPRRVTRWAI